MSEHTKRYKMQPRCPECGMVANEHTDWCPTAKSSWPDGAGPKKTDVAQNGQDKCPKCGELRLEARTMTIDRKTGEKLDKGGFVFELMLVIPAIFLLFLIIMTWAPAQLLWVVAVLMFGAHSRFFRNLGKDRVKGWVCNGCGTATVVHDPSPRDRRVATTLVLEYRAWLVCVGISYSSLIGIGLVTGIPIGELVAWPMLVARDSGVLLALLLINSVWLIYLFGRSIRWGFRRVRK